MARTCIGRLTELSSVLVHLVIGQSDRQQEDQTQAVDVSKLSGTWSLTHKMSVGCSCIHLKVLNLVCAKHDHSLGNAVMTTLYSLPSWNLEFGRRKLVTDGKAATCRASPKHSTDSISLILQQKPGRSALAGLAQ